MKYYFIIILFAYYSTQAEGKSFAIRNSSATPIEVRVWMNGSLIHSHIMPVGQTLIIESNGFDALFQWKVSKECPCIPMKDSKLNPSVKSIGNDWYEVIIPYKNFGYIITPGIEYFGPICKFA